MTASGHPGQPDHQPSWDALTPGTRIDLAKLAPDGAEAARYAGTVVARRDPGSWIVVRSEWTYRQVDVGGLSFVPADVLLEWFSPHLPFNAFATFSKLGAFRGWYANVAYPARLSQPAAAAAPIVVWHDLYLDLVGLPDGTWSLRDEDELRDSGLDTSDPRLFATIQSAAAELQRRFVSAQLPFVASAELRAMLEIAE